MSWVLAIRLISLHQFVAFATDSQCREDPSHFIELKDLPTAGEEELALMTKIVDKMTTDLDLRAYHNGYKERIETLIKSKMKGDAVHLEEEKPKKPVAKSMMEALRETAESLK